MRATPLCRPRRRSVRVTPPGEAGRFPPYPAAARRVHALCGGVARAVRILIRLIQPFESKLIAVEDSLGYYR